MAMQEQTREEMPKAYNPALVEGPIYERWQRSGAFTPEIEPGKEPYSIVMPPPNLTGELHLGHAMMDTVEDVLIRWRRMQGRPALWLPGVDHAAIAVHTLIERQLAAESLTRRDIGREAFLERTWAFVNRNRERIFAQHKRLGISADWTRERFTMDPGPALAVRTIFKDLYDKGLIYRGNRLINWCPFDQSALSDLEVDHKEVNSFLWHVRYPLLNADGSDRGVGAGSGGEDTTLGSIPSALGAGSGGEDTTLGSIPSAVGAGSGGQDTTLGSIPSAVGAGSGGQDTTLGSIDFITIATTRPETIVADTAIAVHPEDPRYKALLAAGVRARVPVIGRKIPIIADEAVEPEFGAGALKVTPGHDPTDFEIGERHSLPTISAIALDGTMNGEAGPYAGLDRFAARDAIVADLKAQGLLVKEEPHTHSVGHCDRCGTIVEPLMSEQWFVAMTRVYGDGRNGPRSLAGDALKAVIEGWAAPDGTRKQIKMVPERHTRVYQNWLEHIRDWCISRQLWWGHRIPVWYCDACGRMTVAIADPTHCEHCGSGQIRQDEDTLDTWFSSALWPFSTLGWPEDTRDLRYFYPTSVMETGYDIIFLWVARMIMMGIFALDQVPFEWVYFHGTVRDDNGERMSKSKGNGVDPEALIERYGSDALRFKLITAGGTGNDQRLEEPRIEAARNFANKLWNASRFVLSYLEPGQRIPAIDPAARASLPAEDRWILSRLDRAVENAGRLMERFELGEAGREMHEFVWDEYCDWYLEIAKVRLRSGEEPSPLPVLVHVLDTALRLLHPYMPYVTEEIWSGSGDLRSHLEDEQRAQLMTAPFPRPTGAPADADAERELSLVLEIVRAVRNLRRERNIDAGRWIEAYVASDAPLSRHTAAIEALARVRPLHLIANAADAPSDSVASAVLEGATVVLPLAGLVDTGAERANLEKQRDEAQQQVESLERQLGNEAFTSRAPEKVVAEARERLEAARSRLSAVEARRAELG
ncbi:MAG: valine--tRNA ligase [Dehalococcoidia bacterium]|nr:valine--tRNA ligase [Dehalococcoidia bacterium]